MSYTSEQRERIMSQARANVRQAQVERAQRRAAAEHAFVFEDPVERWKREGTELMRRQEAAREELRRETAAQAARQQPDWAEVDARIAAAIAAERTQLLDGIAEGLRGLFDTELEPVETIVADLQLMLDGLREQFSQLDDQRSKAIIDLPSSPSGWREVN